MYNVMLDLEALDSRRSAILVSIGAVYFDFATGELGPTFYVELSKKSFQQQLAAGRTFSFDTYEWWMGQSDGARKVFLKNEHNKRDIIPVLHEFAKFCKLSGEQRVRVWGNGVDYDNVVLRDVYETFGIGTPWKYGDNRCYRTIKNLFGNRAKLDRIGDHHNGLSDAQTQAVHLMAMMKKVHVNE